MFCIVTPTIPGREELLREAIRSVKSQTFRDYIHVVCGDGPSPSSEAVCAEEGATWDCLPEKAGYWGYACRNHVLQKYDADYFMFLDDDNVYKPDCLEEVSKHVGPPFIAIQIDFIARWMKPPARWVMPGEPRVEMGYFDQMNQVIRSDIAKKVKFNTKYEHDFDYASECLALSGGEMVLIRKVLGVYSWSWERDHPS
jgi:glycosyltransferase involved in cell wall biosynthesis